MPASIRPNNKATKIAYTIIGVPVALRGVYKLPDQKKEKPDKQEKINNFFYPMFGSLNQ